MLGTLCRTSFTATVKQREMSYRPWNRYWTQSGLKRVFLCGCCFRFLYRFVCPSLSRLSLSLSLSLKLNDGGDEGDMGAVGAGEKGSNTHFSSGRN